MLHRRAWAFSDSGRSTCIPAAGHCPPSPFLCCMRRQSGLERSVRRRDHPAGHLQGTARLHCFVSQRRPAHPRGSAHHHTDASSGGLHLCPHLPNHPPRSIHHRPHRPSVSFRDIRPFSRLVKRFGVEYTDSGNAWNPCSVHGFLRRRSPQTMCSALRRCLWHPNGGRPSGLPGRVHRRQPDALAIPRADKPRPGTAGRPTAALQP